jgi:hypothetical protein
MRVFDGLARPEGMAMRREARTTGWKLDRKYRAALALYAVLAALIWFTMGEERILVQGRPVELRWIPLLVVAGFALKTVLARQAEKIRRQRDGEGE